MNTQNFCVNCNFCETFIEYSGKVYVCKRLRNPITGDFEKCGKLRIPFGVCGQDGKYFKPRKVDE